jgi:hypothetical protein
VLELLRILRYDVCRFWNKESDALNGVQPEHVELLKLLNQVDENKQAKIIQMIRLMVEEV